MVKYPVTDAPPPETAHQIIQTRFVTSSTLSFYDLPLQTQQLCFSRLFNNLSRKFHLDLYHGILSNAGQYRNRSDVNAGQVFFGPPYHGPPRYAGTPAQHIPEELVPVYKGLLKHTTQPIECAFHFYQRFVQIHPFYDANGRIGRLLVCFYLDFHGYYMNWEGFSKTEKWLKKLNACHDRYGQAIYEEYLNYFIIYAKQYIKLKDEYELPKT